MKFGRIKLSNKGTNEKWTLDARDVEIVADDIKLILKEL